MSTNWGTWAALLSFGISLPALAYTVFSSMLRRNSERRMLQERAVHEAMLAAAVKARSEERVKVDVMLKQLIDKALGAMVRDEALTAAGPAKGFEILVQLPDQSPTRIVFPLDATPSGVGERVAEEVRRLRAKPVIGIEEDAENH